MSTPQRPEVVVITGASAGVGRATAQAFARRGARRPAGARPRRAGRGRAGTSRRWAAGASSCRPTSPTPSQVEAAAAAVEEAFGPIDVWVNNAMVSVFSPVKEMKPEEYRRVTEVTYLGYVHGTLAALRRMLPRDRGTIVQVGSALAYRGIPLQSAYCAAKHAIQGFTDSLRCELIHDKSRVRLTMVQMPALNTPQFGWVKSRLPRKAQPVPPIFQPEVAAEAIVWAAHHRPARAVGRLADRRGDRRATRSPRGFGDRYLARTGYDAQQTDEPEDPGRPDNLWEPRRRAATTGARAVRPPVARHELAALGQHAPRLAGRWPPPASRASPAVPGSRGAMIPDAPGGPRRPCPGDPGGWGERRASARPLDAPGRCVANVPASIAAPILLSRMR